MFKRSTRFQRSSGPGRSNSRPSYRSLYNRNRSYYSSNSNRGGSYRRFKRTQSQIDPSKYIFKPKEEVENLSNAQPAHVGKKFSDLNLHQSLLENLGEKGYVTTTKIQTDAIPMIMRGGDFLGISETGSGKTGAFLIPLVNKLLQSKEQKALIIAPTRELAEQIHKEAISLVKYTPIWTVKVVGGESMFRQGQELRKRPQILIGTPGRLKDLSNRRLVRYEEYNNLVLDEVDRMLDMGFVNEIKEIFAQLHPVKQSLFFSATIDNNIERIINGMSKGYKSIKFGLNSAGKNVEQDVIHYARPEEKFSKLHDLLQSGEVEKAIIFISTKRHTERITEMLYAKGIKAESLHGDKPQNKRRNVIKMYKENKFNILVATEVAARGLDITDVTHVINYDEPQTFDQYTHQIGRTGRNGKRGKAYTFVQKYSTF